MEHRLHQNEIATCGSESYAGQNPMQQALFTKLLKLKLKCIYLLCISSFLVFSYVWGHSIFP